MHDECFRAINSLRKNDNIIMIKSNKGSGIIFLNESNYVNKMNKILMINQNLIDLIRSPAMTTQPALNRPLEAVV